MTKLIIATASNPEARSNLQRSVVDGVPLAVVESQSAVLASLPRLRAWAEDGRIRMWGSVAGTADRHRATWPKIEAGDWMAFWVEGGFRFAARVCGGLDSGSLADSV